MLLALKMLMSPMEIDMLETAAPAPAKDGPLSLDGDPMDMSPTNATKTPVLADKATAATATADSKQFTTNAAPPPADDDSQQEKKKIAMLPLPLLPL